MYEGLLAYLESIDKVSEYGTSVMLDRDEAGVKVAQRWTANGVQRWWDESRLGTALSDSQLEAIQQAIDTLNLTLNKTQWYADGSDLLTITIQAIDAGFNGNCTYVITTPEGDRLSGMGTFVNGSFMLTLTTQQKGTHIIFVYAGEKGTGRIEVVAD